MSPGPRMSITWIRGRARIPYTRPNVFLVLGTRGSGKSCLLQHLAEGFLEHGSGVLDLFGSRDGEGLAWLRSPWADEGKALVLRGPGVDVQGSWDSKCTEDLKLSDFERYDLIISASPCYVSIDSELSEAARVTNLLYHRLHWRRLCYCIVREAANLYYSRLKVADSQTQAKAGMIYLIREARHCGLALGLDSLRERSIDIDVRSLADFTFLKSVGIGGLSDDLRWLYHKIDPVALRTLPPAYFAVLSRTGGIGVGHFPFPSWHKKEKEDILSRVGLRVEHGSPVDIDARPQARRGMPDADHARIVELYAAGDVGMAAIGRATGWTHGTVHTHIRKHNEAVERSRFCPTCRRAGLDQGVLTIRRPRRKPGSPDQA